MRKHMQLDQITLGVCYYPEHWSQELWHDDLKRMKEHGITVIRIAEFAWNKFEPQEGQFTFEYFDEFMDMCLEENMKVIFCTPTATPPAWMTEKYPEILNADIDGHLYRHGMRRHNNLTSEKYIEFTRHIVTKLAEHYSKYPNIIGWLIDNEINCENDRYYSDSDHIAFRKYLKWKFKTLDTLNETMGTVFWNQTYTDWNEIYLTRKTNTHNQTNPHMKLEEKRFISYSVHNYIKLQADIIRTYKSPAQFITTNGLFDLIDYHTLTDDTLDFITYDNYPNFAYALDSNPGNGLRDRNSSFNLARTRSISPIFGIMEQQSGPGGWNCRMAQPAPKPGQMRLWSLQAIAHGGDFISFFRWRTCNVGTEIYWHGLNDYSNKPNRRLDELKTISSDILKLKDVTGEPFRATVAILTDYDNSWDGIDDIWHGPMRHKSMDGLFCALQKKHIPFDFVNINDDTNIAELQKYHTIFYPHASIITEQRAKLLEDYAKNGGTIIMGCRTGYKDIYGRCPMHEMPGHLKELCGTTVEDFTLLGPFDEKQYFNWGAHKLEAPIFNDVLSPLPNAQSIATYANNYYAGKCALVKNQYGSGTVYYFGGSFNEETTTTFIDKLDMKQPYNELFEIPEQIELTIRGSYAFLLNYMNAPVEITVHKELNDLLSQEIKFGRCTIEPFGVMCLKVDIQSIILSILIDT